MNLVFEKSDIVTESFVKWLVDDIKYRLCMSLNTAKLDAIQEEADILYNSKINLYDVFLRAVDNLTYTSSEYAFTIAVDIKSFVPNTLVKYDTVIKLIEYGNTSVDGCMVFSKVFYSVKTNLNTYFTRYKFGLGGGEHVGRIVR